MVEHGSVGRTSLTDRLMRSRRRILVLDDDPTGSQTAAGVPIATDFSSESIEWALREAAPTAFVLTNSRAMNADTTEKLTREITGTAVEAANRLGLDLSIVSRSDSTLRGHFPLEVDVIVGAVAAGLRRAIVVCPAYPAAGRITRRGRHLVRTGDEWTPVGHTPYAKDATFGFSSSTLPDWVQERSHGRWTAAECVVVTTTDIGRGAAHVSQLISAAAGTGDPTPVCVDAEFETDLDIVAEALELCEESGVRTLVRCGPSLARARGGLPHSDRTARESLRAAMDPKTLPHGLVVAGSHVALTTAQLTHLETLPHIVTVELATTDLIDPDRRQSAIAAAADHCVDALRGADVVLRTSRTVTVGRDGQESLSIAASVAHALTSTAAAVVAAAPPRWLVAKGGITSADVVTTVLGLRRAKVLGPLLDGIVPVWVDESRSGPLCVVFPGNVGGPESLRDAVSILRDVN